MRSAETVLAIVRERGKRGLPLEDVYRMLYNPDLYLRAYARLYKNKGAMTQGTTAETVDAMSLAKIERLIDDVRSERHRWTPVRRVHIPKRREDEDLRAARVERQTAARSDALRSGSLLRAADESTLTWVPSWSRMPHSTPRDPDDLDWFSLAGGGRYRQIFRHDGPRGLTRYSQREHS